ncbi:MAG: hypothetical protein LBS92_07510 [Candidatus Methanoplasma sp.]|jgi:glucose/mannose-6-phosphate isomerase|nr:hypothetical protein [Candidatus Methanoplasma sp.]
MTAESDKFQWAAMLPEQIEESLKSQSAVRSRPEGDVCVFGVGTSALAGEILSDYMDCQSRSQICVVRGAELPGWVDKNTTAIVVSYSGDTAEALAAYDRLRARGCVAVCVTSGGELLERGLSNGDCVVRLPQGLVSKDALGYILGSLAVVVESMGVCKAATDLKALIPELKRYRDSLVCESRVERMASMLVDKIPVIYSIGSMRSSAVRWRMQIGENTGFPSFCGFLPEFNHNEIVGWTGDSNHGLFVPVVLYDEGASLWIKNMTCTSMDILKEKGFEIATYDANGSGCLEKNVKCIMMGDLVSARLTHLYVAKASG